MTELEQRQQQPKTHIDPVSETNQFAPEQLMSAEVASTLERELEQNSEAVVPGRGRLVDELEPACVVGLRQAAGHNDAESSRPLGPP